MSLAQILGVRDFSVSATQERPWFTRHHRCYLALQHSGLLAKQDRPALGLVTPS
jgi:hypothetical protein